MIAYSPEAEPARAYLLRGYNDIDIFVEDVLAQNVYVVLFGRMLEGVATINEVFPLHNRKNVLAACANDQAVRQRRRIYIIDGDQDLIHDRQLPTLSHLYRLSVYCSENLLLSEAAAIRIGMESSPSETWHSVAASLALRSFLEDACLLLAPLFVAYALAEQFGLELQTVSFPVQRLLAIPSDPGTLSKKLINRRIMEIKTAILQVTTLQMYKAARNLLTARLIQTPLDISRFLSGKTYLIPLLHLRLRQRCGLQGSMDSLKVRLASSCELTIDPNLPVAMANATR